MREKLTKVPAKMQGNPIMVSGSGMYLGMKVSQNCHRDSVDMTIKHRVAKAWGRVAEIKAQINELDKLKDKIENWLSNIMWGWRGSDCHPTFES